MDIVTEAAGNLDCVEEEEENQEAEEEEEELVQGLSSMATSGRAPRAATPQHQRAGAAANGRSGEAADEEEDEASRQLRREANIRALVAGPVAVARVPLVRGLSAAAELALRRPFKSPHPNAPAGMSQVRLRRGRARARRQPACGRRACRGFKSRHSRAFL
jgi:hypothetical protein